MREEVGITIPAVNQLPAAWLPGIVRIAGADDIPQLLAGIALLLEAAIPHDALVLSCQYRTEAFEKGFATSDAELIAAANGLTAQVVGFYKEGGAVAGEIEPLPFFGEVAARRRWQYGLAISIPYRGIFGATAMLYRRAGQGRFDAATIRNAQMLRPICERVLHRVLGQQQALALNKNLIGFLNDLPVGLILLDWEWSILFVNREGYRQALHWNHAPDAPPRTADPMEEFRVPEELWVACNRLRNRRLQSGREFDPGTESSITVEHPARPELRFSITESRSLNDPREPPKLLVRFYGMATRSEPQFEPSPEQLKLLAQLTAAERSVALLVRKGLSNKQIAERLHREVSTVKDHLTHIFAKLAIRSRAQLARLLA